jgi:hypothetical protein
MLKYEFLLIWKYTSIIANENFIIFFSERKLIRYRMRKKRRKNQVFLRDNEDA